MNSWSSPFRASSFRSALFFFNNFGLNRDLGVMGYGRLFDNKFEYAAGIFNGSRNGFVAPTDNKFFAGYVNFKPFVNAEGSVFENFNIGGSVLEGNEQIVPIPAILAHERGNHR